MSNEQFPLPNQPQNLADGRQGWEGVAPETRDSLLSLAQQSALDNEGAFLFTQADQVGNANCGPVGLFNAHVIEQGGNNHQVNFRGPVARQVAPTTTNGDELQPIPTEQSDNPVRLAAERAINSGRIDGLVTYLLETSLDNNEDHDASRNLVNMLLFRSIIDEHKDTMAPELLQACEDLHHGLAKVWRGNDTFRDFITEFRQTHPLAAPTESSMEPAPHQVLEVTEAEAEEVSDEAGYRVIAALVADPAQFERGLQAMRQSSPPVEETLAVFAKWEGMLKDLVEKGAYGNSHAEVARVLASFEEFRTIHQQPDKEPDNLPELQAADVVAEDARIWMPVNPTYEQVAEFLHLGPVESLTADALQVAVLQFGLFEELINGKFVDMELIDGWTDAIKSAIEELRPNMPDATQQQLHDAVDIMLTTRRFLRDMTPADAPVYMAALDYRALLNNTGNQTKNDEYGLEMASFLMGFATQVANHFDHKKHPEQALSKKARKQMSQGTDVELSEEEKDDIGEEATYAHTLAAIRRVCVDNLEDVEEVRLVRHLLNTKLHAADCRNRSTMEDLHPVRLQPNVGKLVADTIAILDRQEAFMMAGNPDRTWLDGFQRAVLNYGDNFDGSQRAEVYIRPRNRQASIFNQWRARQYSLASPIGRQEFALMMWNYYHGYANTNVQAAVKIRELTEEVEKVQAFNEKVAEEMVAQAIDPRKRFHGRFFQPSKAVSANLPAVSAAVQPIASNGQLATKELNRGSS